MELQRGDGKDTDANAPIVIFHKDHPLSPDGINAGAEMATLSLARAFVRKGRRVVIAAQIGDASLRSSLEQPHRDGVFYFDLGNTFDSQRAFAEFDRVFSAGYHLIVASRAQALLESRYNPKILSRLFISHEPAATALGMQPSIIGRVADRVISVSEAQRQGLIEAGCGAEKISIIPNGADLDLFQSGDPERRNYRRIIFVGALVMDKGVHLLIEAFAALRNHHPDLTLDVYGSAKMWGRADYFDTARAAQIPGITFHGAVPQKELTAAYRSAGLLVLPSMWFDSFPLTAVEAQVSGLPVLGSPLGGMKEIIRDGVTGRLLTEVTPQKIAEELDRLVSNPNVLKGMSRAAITQLRPLFGWDRIADQFLTLQEQYRPGSAAGQDRSTAEQRQTTEKKVQAMNPTARRIGILSTFNQRCGLASYAASLLGELKGENVIVLAEDVAPGERLGPDAANVRRCWRRMASDLSQLEQVIDREGITLLHLNCHYRFFEPSAIRNFLNRCRSKGIGIVSGVHNPYTVDPALRELVRSSDRVIVHMAENRLELVANGARPDSIDVIEVGVGQPTISRDNARRELNIAPQKKAVVTFGFIQPHKGLDEVIEAFARVRASGVDAHLYCVGGVHTEDVTSAQYAQVLQQMVQSGGLRDVVTFVDGYVTDEVVDKYLAAADAVVMNYRSQYFEGSAAVARALGCGAPVITSTAPTFARLGDAVLHTTSGFPLPLALQLVLTQPELSAELKRTARAWADRYSWAAVAKQFVESYRKCPIRAAAPAATTAQQPAQTISRSSASTSLRVLMQNRGNALTQRGGDTVVMEHLAEELRALGVTVEFDFNGQCRPADFDLVHLFNFATPDITRRYAEQCTAAGKPFVVTTLYEDLPVFYHQMIAHGDAVRKYVSGGQVRESWQALATAARHVPPAARWENGWTAERAATLLASGETEAALLRKDYPTLCNVDICRFGTEPMVRGNASAFKEQFGVSDFVLCVGRLETRKNQLMLLKALEDSELTVVFATGGFTYQPEYEEACRRFQRKGKTIFLGRLEPQMLANAYAACRIHALPSWYEIPGLVSLEAASVGKNVVVTDRGTTRDYFGNEAFYCSPEDPKSIYNAVIDAYYAIPRPELQALASSFTWARAAKDVLEAYKRATTAQPAAAGSRLENAVAGIDNARLETLRASSSVGEVSRAIAVGAQAKSRAEELCDSGDAALRSGKLDDAAQCYRQAIEISPDVVRGYRCLGVVALHREELSEAEEWFQRALKTNPRDPKSVTGLGAAQWNLGRRDDAFRSYLQALDIDPCESAALLHLINAAYVLNRLADLEARLKNYLARTPESADMRYCLAGCYYKQGKLADTARELERVLQLAPNHRDATELKRLVERDTPAVGVSAGAPSTTLLRAKYADEVEGRLRVLEQAKEARDYEKLIAGAGEILNAERASDDQRDLARVLRAEAYALSGKLVEADSEFKAVEHNGGLRHRVLAGRGAIAAASERWDDAESFFSRALTVVSDYDVAFAGIGICRLQQSQWQSAWDYFQRALAVNPENMRALLGVVQLGYPLSRLREVEAATGNYLEMHPANLSILYAFAGCCYAQGKRAQALEALEKIRLFDPENKLANELLDKILSESQPIQQVSRSA